jgi:hypothetical protein
LGGWERERERELEMCCSERYCGEGFSNVSCTQCRFVSILGHYIRSLLTKRLALF